MKPVEFIYGYLYVNAFRDDHLGSDNQKAHHWRRLIVPLLAAISWLYLFTYVWGLVRFSHPYWHVKWYRHYIKLVQVTTLERSHECNFSVICRRLPFSACPGPLLLKIFLLTLPQCFCRSCVVDVSTGFGHPQIGYLVSF